MIAEKHNKGLTLIELLIAIALTSIIGLGLVSLQYILSQNQIAITKSYKNVDDANYAASQIVKEIRGARQSDNGAYYLDIADDQELAFYSDIDLDGKSEYIRYVLEEKNLVKEITRPSGYPPLYDPAVKSTFTFCENVQNAADPIFFYYNEQWPEDDVNNPLPSNDRLSETRTIKVYLKVNSGNDAKRDYVVESFAQVRSVKDNL